MLRGLWRHRLVWNDDELVATQPGNHAPVAGAGAEALGEPRMNQSPAASPSESLIAFGRHVGLGEQSRDGLEGVLRLRLPPTAATLDEPEHAGGQRAGGQRGGDHHRSTAATARRNGASEATVFVMTVNNQILAVFAQR